MVHAENGEAVEDGRAAVFGAGITGPEGHSLSRPAEVEVEATGRALRLAALTGAPVYVGTLPRSRMWSCAAIQS